MLAIKSSGGTPCTPTYEMFYRTRIFLKPIIEEGDTNYTTAIPSPLNTVFTTYKYCDSSRFIRMKLELELIHEQTSQRYIPREVINRWPYPSSHLKRSISTKSIAIFDMGLSVHVKKHPRHPKAPFYM